MLPVWEMRFGSHGPILAIWWLLSLVAAVVHVSFRTVGSYPVSNSLVVRTGLPINKSTCYGVASGSSNLIQASLM